MAAEIVAQVSIGQCVPTAAVLNLQMLAVLQGKLAAALNIQAALTIQLPSLSLQLDGALKAVASLKAMLSAGLTIAPPGVALSVTANLQVIAELKTQIALLLALQVTLGTAGVYVLTHEGDAPTFGPEMQAQVSAIAPPGNNVHAVTFLATDPAVFEALGKVLLTG